MVCQLALCSLGALFVIKSSERKFAIGGRAAKENYDDKSTGRFGAAINQ